MWLPHSPCTSPSDRQTHFMWFFTQNPNTKYFITRTTPGVPAPYRRVVVAFSRRGAQYFARIHGVPIVFINRGYLAAIITSLLSSCSTSCSSGSCRLPTSCVTAAARQGIDRSRRMSDKDTRVRLPPRWSILTHEYLTVTSF